MDILSPTSSALEQFDAYIEVNAPTDFLWLWHKSRPVQWICRPELDRRENARSFNLTETGWCALETVLLLTVDREMTELVEALAGADQQDHRRHLEHRLDAIEEHRHALKLLEHRNRFTNPEAPHEEWRSVLFGANHHIATFYGHLMKCCSRLWRHDHPYRLLIEALLATLAMQSDSNCKSFHLPSEVNEAQARFVEAHRRNLEAGDLEKRQLAKAAELNASLASG